MDPFALSFHGPNDAGCPSERDVAANIAQLTGIHADDQPDVAALAEVRRRSGSPALRLSLTMRMDGREVTRVVDGDTCRELGDATAVIVAWLLAPKAMEARDLGAVRAGESAAPAPAISSPLPPSVVSASPSPPSVASTSPSPPFVASAQPNQRAGRASAPQTMHSFVEMGGWADQGTLPLTAFGGRAGVGIHWKTLRLLLYGGYLPAVHTEVPGGTSAQQAAFWLLLGGAEACWTSSVAHGAARVGPCLGLEAEWLSGHASGIRFPERASRVLPASAVGPWLGVRVLGAVELAATAMIAVPWWRPSFTIEGHGEVHRPSALPVRAGLSIDIGF